MCYHTRLMFAVLVQRVFHCAGQAGLKLLTAGDPPTSASQSAGIMGVSQRLAEAAHFIMVGFMSYQ